ncbi:hypothetical protein [Patulibacter defluvii]|uniref:hypothetical protein n=1 Tax=Patulibacter defluvii TaxID=3095358 RepID=UPI002A75BF7C|nr:hypothetical protein [Patulibacter sp. DM4]
MESSDVDLEPPLSFRHGHLFPLVGFGVAALLSAAVFALRWHQDWNVSEGTYALTARALLDGGDLYGQLVVAQPPLAFGIGAGVLAVVDSLDALRAAMALLQLASLAMLATVAWRISGSRLVAAVLPPLGMLLPWSVHEQGIFSVEAVALPLLAAAAVLGARRSGSLCAGALLAAAIGVKLPMALPAVVTLWFLADRKRGLFGFAASAAAIAGGSLSTFGSGVIEQAVLAQLEVGRHDLHYLAELAAQVLWNMAGLALGLLAVVVAYRNGWRPRDDAQWRVAVAISVGMLLTAGSLLKTGTSLTVLAPIEALLLPLAVTGGWLAAQHPGRWSRLAAVVVVAFSVAQSAALLASPRTGGHLFSRPGAVAWGIGLTRAETDAQVAAARRCPATVAFSGTTTVAFRAHRRMPGGQPDVFLPSHAQRLKATADAVAADVQRCP